MIKYFFKYETLLVVLEIASAYQIGEYTHFLSFRILHPFHCKLNDNVANITAELDNFDIIEAFVLQHGVRADRALISLALTIL